MKRKHFRKQFYKNAANASELDNVTKLMPLQPMVSPEQMEQFFSELGHKIIKWCDEHNITDYSAAAEIIGEAVADEMAEELIKGHGESEPIGILGNK